MWIPREPDGLERLLRDEGDLSDLGPRHARDRVEVDAQLVGVVEVFGADRVRVEIDAPEVVDPGEAGGIVDDDLVGGPPGWERQRGDPQPVGLVVGCPLLEERLAVGAVDEPLQRHRPATCAAQRSVGDGLVVVDEVHLRVAGGLEVDLVGVRDRDLPAGNLEDLLARGHANTIAPRHERLSRG